MKNEILKKIFVAVFITGLIIVLKVKFNVPYFAIIFLIGLGLIAGLIRNVVFGFVNPPDWLYRIRFSILGIFYGTFIGIMLFGMEAIEKNTFIFHDLIKLMILCSVIGGVLNGSMFFSKSQKLMSRKGLFLLERQLIKDFAHLIKLDGEEIKGKLVLTSDHLIFMENEEKILEKEVIEITPNINKSKLLGIPNGFRIVNDEILLKVPFPNYWLKRINKRKKVKIKMAS